MKTYYRARFRVAAIAAMMLVVFACSAVFVGHGAEQAASAAPARPVLVELFTSEGCSDCPPADNLLARLDAEQPVDGVHVIVLSEHVTYWNHDGWRDPFSLLQMDERQTHYVEQFQLQSSYTPQAVIDGAEQVVGNDARHVLQAVQHEAGLPEKQLTIAQATLEKGTVSFAVRAPESDGDNLVAALAQDVSRSEVTRGENAGRTLHHVAVVRAMKEFKADFAQGRALSLSANDPDRHPGAGAMRLVVFLEDTRSGRVVGAAEKVLTSAP